MKKIFLSILLLISFASAVGQELPVTLHLNMDDGLKQNTVTELVQDDYGRMWIGSSGGLQYYTGYNFVDIDEVNDRVLKLHIVGNSLYCLSIKTIYKIDVSSLESIKYEFDKIEYYTIQFEKEEINLFFPDVDKVIVFDYNLNVIQKVNHAKYDSQIYKDFSLGGITINNEEEKVYYLNPDTINITTIYHLNSSIFNENRAFIASFEGLIEIENNGGEITKKIHFPNLRIEKTYLDRNKNLWLASADDGLFMVHYNSLQTKFYPIISPTNKPIPCWAMFEIEGEIYTTTSEGVSCLSNTEGEDVYENLAGNLACFSAIYDNGVLMLGTKNKGVFRVKNKKLEQMFFNEKESLDCLIIQIITNEKGFLGISKKSFIQFDSDGQFLFSKKYDFPFPSIYVMSLMKTDYGYLASTTLGVFELDEKLNIQANYQSDEVKVVCQSVSYEEELISVSMDAGLLKIGNDSLKVLPFMDSHLVSVLNYNNDLWMSSFTGFYQYNDSIVRPYFKQNGFPINEYNQGGSYQKDKLFFSGVGGVVEFDPDSIQTMPQLPEILFKRNNEFIELDKKIRLNYDQSEIVMELIPVLLTDKNLFQFEYKWDEDWTVFDKEIQLVLSADWGENKLEVRASNAVNSEFVNYILPVFRQQPFWTFWWFKMLAFIALLGLIAGIYAYIKFLQTKKLLRQELADKKINEERLRISSELHDNIGARLTHIISSLDIEMYQRKDNVTSIENINSFARETMSQLRETIWAVSDKTIFFSEFSHRVEQYVQQVDKMTKTEIIFSKDKITDFELNPIQTINYYRIIQEAINNAIKYSEATIITININSQLSIIEIQITDNGIGFDLNKKKLGTGLSGMKSRAQEAGAQFELKSTKEQGTILKIKIKKT